MEKLLIRELKPVLKTTFVKIQPYECEADYMKSIQMMGCDVYIPWSDTPNLSSLYQLLKAKENKTDAELNLHKVGLHYESQLPNHDREWVNIYDKLSSLRNYFVSQELFLKENEDKRNRAEKKMIEDKYLINQRSQKMIKTKKEYELLLTFKMKTEENVKKYKIYEDFLNQVTSCSLGQFKSVLDVISRYDSLVHNRETIAALRAKQFNEIDYVKRGMADLIENKFLQMLDLNQKTVKLVSRYDVAKKRVLHWESVVGEVRKFMEMKIREQDSIYVCVRNLCTQMCYRKNINPTKMENDIYLGLLFIKRTLYELKKAYQMAEKLFKKNPEKRKVNKFGGKLKQGMDSQKIQPTCSLSISLKDKVSVEAPQRSIVQVRSNLQIGMDKVEADVRKSTILSVKMSTRIE